MFATAMFSSRWLIEDVPGIKSTSGRRSSSQASATWAGVQRRRAAVAATAGLAWLVVSCGPGGGRAGAGPESGDEGVQDNVRRGPGGGRLGCARDVQGGPVQAAEGDMGQGL